MLAESQISLGVVRDGEASEEVITALNDLDERVQNNTTNIQINQEDTDINLEEIKRQIETKVATETLRNYLDWSTSEGLNIRDFDSTARVNIASDGISLYGENSAHASATIGQTDMTIPRANITQLIMGDYLLEYMEADGSLTLKEVK